MLKHVIKLVLVIICCISYGIARSNEDERVRLENVKAITLHRGKLTTGRRSSPVPQLKCVGGSAGCSAFVPEVVQCQNVGSDGFDVQWECKTDMDDSYRFGKIQVSCEGYDHPNDPYILRGSCGLEYTIDYTEAGRKQGYGGSSYYPPSQYSKHSTGFGSWFFFIAIVAGIVFMIYKMGGGNDPVVHRPPPSPGYHGPGAGYGNSPPPYGFKPEYTSTGSPPPYADATSQPHASTSYETFTRPHRRQGPGFWSGMGLGGLAGYMFGSRNNHGYYNRGYGSGYGYGNRGGYGSGFGSSWGGSSSSQPRNRGTTSRTTSGFGGTSRR